MVVGQVEIQMLANLARLQSDMNQAKSMVGGAMSNIESAVGKAKAVLGALGLGLGVGYFVSLIKGSIDAADHLHDLSKSTSIAVEQLAGLKLAAKQSGGDLDSIAASINKLSVNIGKDAEKFALLGVTAKDPLKAFQQLADAFVAIQDPQQRAAVMTIALGKSWAGAAPLLSEGGKAIGEMVAKGTALSGITSEMTARSDRFKDKLDEISTAGAGATTRLVGQLLPALTALADNFTLVRNVVASVVAAKIAGWASEAAVALYTTVTANMAKTAATLAAAQADVVATGTAVALTTGRVAEMRAAAAAAGGETALAIVTTGLVPMQAKAALAAEAHAVALGSLAVATRAASVTAAAGGVALGLLSGPVGWITLALGLGATAWSLWGKSASDAVNTANDAVARGLAIAQRYQKEAKFGTGDAGDLKLALEAVDQKILALSMPGKQPMNASEQLKGLRLESLALLVALDRATNATTGMTEAQKKLAAAAAKFIHDNDAAGKVAVDTDSAYLKLIRSIDEATAATARELAGEAKQTAGQKLALDAMLKLQDGTLNLSASQKIQLAAHLTGMLAGEAALIRQAALTESYVAITTESMAVEQEVAALLDAIATKKDDAMKSMQASIEQIQFETTLIGLSNDERTLAIALLALESAGVKKGTADYEAMATSMKKALDTQSIAQAAADKMKHAAQDQADAWRRAGADIADSLTEAFGAGGSAAGGMVKAFSEGIAKQLEMDKAYETARAALAMEVLEGKAGAEDKLAQLREAHDAKNLQNALKSYGDMAGAAASFFDEQSDAYKVLSGIEKAMYMLRFALQAEALIHDLFFTTSSVANSGTRASADGIAAFAKTLASLPFPYNLAAGAVVVGALAAMGVAISGGFSSSGGAQTAAERQKQQGTGTVLGDSEAKSNSLLEAIKEIEKTDKTGFIYTHDMLDALRSIQDSMAGLASLIFRTTGLTTGSGFGVTESVVKNRGDPIANMVFDPSLQFLDKMANKIPVIGPLIGAIQGLWGKTSIAITDSGLMVAGTMRELSDGRGVSAYANVDKTTSSFFGLVKNTSSETVSGAVNAQIASQFALVFKSISDSVEAAARALDVWSPALVLAIQNTVIDLGKISFQGLKGQELQDALNAVLSAASDSLAQAILPGFAVFQKVGEGYYQTMIRVATTNEFAKNTIDALGLTIGLTGMAAVSARMNLIELAGGVDNFAKLTQSYYDNFYTDAERQANAIANLTREFGAMGLALPTTNAGFRALVESLDLSTAAGQTTFTQLMRLAPAFAEVTKAALDAGTAVQTLAQQIAAVQSSAASAVDAQIQASQAAAQSARQAADTYRALAASLADAVIRIRGGGVAGASGRLQSVFGAAMTGDTAALAGLPQAANDFLAASLATSRTATEFARAQAQTIGMLERAGAASTAVATFQDYQATLLETQTAVLEAIKAQLDLPSPDAAILAQQAGLLSTIATLLREQTTQIVTGNGAQFVLMQDQTGKITLGNTLVGAQTGQIITGNAVQDVIRNLSSLNTSYSVQMLASLVEGSGTQVSSLEAMVSGNTRIVSLLTQMLGYQNQAAQQAYTAAFNTAAQQIYASTGTIGVPYTYYDEDTDSMLTGIKQKFNLAAYDAAIAAWRAANPMPHFASGGVASGWSMVGERGPELVDFTSPGRVYSADQTRSAMGAAANDDLLAEVRALRLEVAGLRAEAAKTSRNTGKTADTLIRVTRDGESILTEAA